MKLVRIRTDIARGYAFALLHARLGLCVQHAVACVEASVDLVAWRLAEEVKAPCRLALRLLSAEFVDAVIDYLLDATKRMSFNNETHVIQRELWASCGRVWRSPLDMAGREPLLHDLSTAGRLNLRTERYTECFE